MNKRAVVEKMCASGILPVFRTDDVKHLFAASRAYFDAGIACIEYTLTMPGALELLRRARRVLPREQLLGAGTVMDARDVERAVKAGAQFIAGPGFNPEVVDACDKLGVVSVAGAVTPTEIMEALNAGADVIKVFPAVSVGPAFFAEVRGPFPGARLMAAGGITLENIRHYIAAGAAVATLPAQGIAPAAYAAGDVQTIERLARRYVAAVVAARRAAAR